MTSVSSQVRLKSKSLIYLLNRIGEQNNDVNPRPTGVLISIIPHWGLFRAPWSLILGRTGPILKIKTGLESPGKNVEGKPILTTSVLPVTSQVRSVKMFYISICWIGLARKTTMPNKTQTKPMNPYRWGVWHLYLSLWVLGDYSRSRSSEVTRSKS